VVPILMPAIVLASCDARVRPAALFECLFYTPSQFNAMLKVMVDVFTVFLLETILMCQQFGQ
jgi:hypothetical protein